MIREDDHCCLWIRPGAIFNKVSHGYLKSSHSSLLTEVLCMQVLCKSPNENLFEMFAK